MYLQEGHVGMEICTAKDMGLILQLLALRYSTMAWAVELVTNCDAMMTPNGASLASSLWQPPTFALLIMHSLMTMVAGATPLLNILIWQSLLSCTLLNIELELYPYSSEGTCVYITNINVY